MKIGFAKKEITPPLGTELGGYAGYRPCNGVHDPLYCKTVVLEQEDGRYGLVVLDLLCVDIELYHRIGCAVAELGISRERLIVAAIHSHCTPLGVFPGEGPMGTINGSEIQSSDFSEYMEFVVRSAFEACQCAVMELEPFQVRSARGAVPEVGSERHTGERAQGSLTVLEIRTQSGKTLIVYNFPCHPTVLGPGNLLVSADFVSGIEALLGCDMAVFLNGAAGDISTRFTRREATFQECERMGTIAAEAVKALIAPQPFREPDNIKGTCKTAILRARQTEPEGKAQEQYERLTARWQQAQAEGADAQTVRLLKSYAEGAGVSLEFSRTLGGVTEFQVPITVFRFAGMDFATVPGELFSTLLPGKPLSVIAYANGYYRYFADEGAYDRGFYEAMAAIVAKGQGEKLMEEIMDLLKQIDT